MAENSDVILLSLPKPTHIRAVVTNMYDKLKKGQVKEDLSTVDPQTSMEMNELMGKKCVGYLDALILGRPISIGPWLLLVGGVREHLDYARPVLSDFANKMPRVGVSGTATVSGLF